MLARSAHLAASHAGGLLEPLYALHSARLKLLDALPAPGSAGESGDAAAAGLLEAVARHRFLPPGGSASQPGRCSTCGLALQPCCCLVSCCGFQWHVPPTATSSLVQVPNQM
jgi:hypothetical protein